MPKEAPQSLYDVTAGRAEQKVYDRLCEERGISTETSKAKIHSIFCLTSSSVQNLGKLPLIWKERRNVWKAFAMQESKWAGIVMMNAEEQSRRRCSSAHVILRASCHPTLCSLYTDIKSLRLMNLLQAGYLRHLKFMSAHVIRAGWIHTYPEHIEVLSPLSAQHGYVWNGSNLIKDSFVLTGIRSRTLYICHPSIALEYIRVLKRDRSEDRDRSKRTAAGSQLEITSYNSVWANIKWWDREGSAPASLQINQPSSYCLVLPSAGGLLSLY